VVLVALSAPFLAPVCGPVQCEAALARCVASRRSATRRTRALAERATALLGTLAAHLVVAARRAVTAVAAPRRLLDAERRALVGAARLLATAAAPDSCGLAGAASGGSAVEAPSIESMLAAAAGSDVDSDSENKSTRAGKADEDIAGTGSSDSSCPSDPGDPAVVLAPLWVRFVNGVLQGDPDAPAGDGVATCDDVDSAGSAADAATAEAVISETFCTYAARTEREGRRAAQLVTRTVGLLPFWDSEQVRLVGGQPPEQDSAMSVSRPFDSALSCAHGPILSSAALSAVARVPRREPVTASGAASGPPPTHRAGQGLHLLLLSRALSRVTRPQTNHSTNSERPCTTTHRIKQELSICQSFLCLEGKFPRVESN